MLEQPFPDLLDRPEIRSAVFARPAPMQHRGGVRMGARIETAEGLVQSINEVPAAVAALRDMLSFHLAQDAVDFSGVRSKRGEQSHELFHRPQEVDIVLPQRIVGIKDQAWRHCSSLALPRLSGTAKTSGSSFHYIRADNGTRPVLAIRRPGRALPGIGQQRKSLLTGLDR